MPKAKPKTDKGIPGLDADDVAAFKAALSSDSLAEETTEVENPVAADPAEATDVPTAGRRVPVAIEPMKKSRRGPSVRSTGDIEDVWHGQQSPPSPPATFQQARRRGPWGWIIGGLAVLAAASVAGFFVLNRSAKFSGNNIQVVINTPKQAASGGDIALTIDFQNQEPVGLLNGQLTVEYPEGFTYTSSSVASSNDFHNAFPVGRIASGRAGEVVIHGTIIGSVDAKLTFTATLTYRPANFSSDFQEQGSATVTISSSILGVTIDGPTKIAPSGSGTWSMTLNNTSDHDIHHVRLDAVIPDGLTLTKVSPAASEGTASWILDTLAQGDKKVMTLTGTANGTLGDSLELQAKVGIINAAGGLDPQDQQSLLIILINTGLTTTVAINGQTDSSSAVPGDTLNYTIRVANKGDAEVADVTVSATLDGSGLDLTTLANPLKAAVKNKTLTWTKQQVTGLSVVQPGHDVSLTFSVGTTKNLVVKNDSDRDPHVSLTVVTAAPSLATNTNTSTPSTVALTKYQTIFISTADARYYDDNQVAVGTGPVPPAVAKTTSYRVIWKVTNSTSDATDQVVSTTLPVGVLWTGQNIGRDAGDIAFDPNSRTVRWTLNKVPAGTGSRLPTLTAHFDVSITPTSDQVGSVVVLTDTTTGTATDSYSGKSLSSTSSSLTTDVPNDPQAAGEGKVVAS